MPPRRIGLRAKAVIGWAGALSLAFFAVGVPLGGGLRASLASAAEAVPLEVAVKAAYVYKFAPFIDWPSASAPTPAVVICVQGDDGFAGMVQRAVMGQQLGDRPYEVRRLVRVDAGAGCQIAYLAGSPVQSRTEALKALEHTGALTITDEAHGVGAKGIVHLVVSDGRVRFDIDNAAASREGLSISSKLLSLAVHVRNR